LKEAPSFWFDLIEQNDFHILPLTTNHTITYEKLPFIHRDPFDRILIAQAISDKLVIVTKDQNIPLYKVKTVW
jgi:PIN domain nuclease of toxin-antitoxin system